MENRLRVKKSVLSLVGGKFFYEGEPFTGVVFDEQDEFIVSANVVEQGVVTGEYQNGYFDTPKDALLMTEDNPILDWSEYNYLPQVKHDGKYVNGVMYRFEDGVSIKDGVCTTIEPLSSGVCTKETLIINGWEEIELSWHRTNGTFEMYFNWLEQHVGGGFVFDDSSRLTRFTVGKGENLKLAVDFSRENAIEKLGLNKNFFSVKHDDVDNLPFKFITQNSDFLKYHAGEEIYLSKNGITDELFEFLSSNGFFSKTVSILFIDTAITQETVENLALLPALLNIKIHDEHGTLAPAVQELKRQKPGLNIEYEIKPCAD